MNTITPLDALIALGEENLVSDGIPTNDQEYSDMIFRVDGALISPTWHQVLTKMTELESEQPAKEARGERDRLLTESDWVTIRATDTGNPVPTEWQTYRQALRDITEQTGFPESIEWPEKPES